MISSHDNRFSQLPVNLPALTLWCFGVGYPTDGNVFVEIQEQNVLIIAVPYSNQPSAIQQKAAVV